MNVAEVNDLLITSLVPELSMEIGTCQIKEKEFSEFVNHVEQNLYLLFDFISHNDAVLLDGQRDNTKFRLNFIQFLCEQTGNRCLFHIRNEYLKENIEKFTSNYFSKILKSDDTILEDMFKIYKSKIGDYKWKKNIGGAHGFVRFCELFYLGQDTIRMESDYGRFILSVGSQFIAHFYPEYKSYGVKLFLILLQSSDPSYIRQSNTHEVIYVETLANIHKISNEKYVSDLWKCIYHCIELDYGVENNLEWNKIDDCLKILISQLKISSNINMIKDLYKTLMKFLCLNLKDEYIMSIVTSGDELEFVNNLENIRDILYSYNNYKSYRWVRSLLELFTILLNNCLQSWDYNQTNYIVNAIHAGYLVAFFPISIELIEEQIHNFVRRIGCTLQNIIHHSNDGNIKKNIYKFQQTLLLHMKEKTNDHTDNVYYEALEKFINTILPDCHSNELFRKLKLKYPSKLVNKNIF